MRPVRTAFALVALLLVFIALAYLLVAVLPEELAHTDGLTAKEARAEVGRVRTALLAVVAGGIAATTAFLSALNYNLNRRVANQTHERDREGQITERFTRAIDQLGHDKLDVRLGGIYALERIARDSAADQPQVVEVLTAYVREHAPLPSEAGHLIVDTASDFPVLATDVQAALTVLGRRELPPGSQPQVLDLSRTNLRGAQLAKASFDGVKIDGAWLEFADLTEAQLVRAEGRGARLKHAMLAGANLEKATLPRAVLQEAELAGARLHGAFLRQAQFDHASLRHADLSGATLYGATLEGTDMSGARAIGVDMRRANARDADLSRADLTSARLHGALLQDAALDDVTLDEAEFNVTTTWPVDFRPEDHGARGTLASRDDAKTNG